MNPAEEFAANFRGEPVPPELARLLAFDLSTEAPYSDGFELLGTNGEELASWSDDPAFVKRLFVFAEASASGSLYAIWRADPRATVADSPVVIFGDEGGAHVVAANVPELLELLTFDAEPMASWDEVHFYRDDDDYEPSGERDRYMQWLSEELGLDPVADPAAVVARAQVEYGEAFSSWLAAYVPE
jgi:hypothetical protein